MLVERMPSSQIAVRLENDQLAAIDAAVSGGRFESRASAVRAGIDRVLREERDREIGERYRRGYAQHPQEAWIGEIGLELGAELARRERSGSSAGERREDPPSNRSGGPAPRRAARS